MNTGTHLCRGVFQPSCLDAEPVQVFCQAVVVDGDAYAWVDGVNEQDPLLIPVKHLVAYSYAGTLRQYLADPRHAALGDAFDEFLDLVIAKRASATLIVRACEIMHEEHVLPQVALATSEEWGHLLGELDHTERAAYQMLRH